MNKVPREVTTERETRAWELRQQRWTHARIAAELGVDASTVTRILARLNAKYAKTLLANVAAVQGDQLHDLAFIRDEALAAWERSKLPAETVTTKTVAVVGIAVGDEAPEPIDDVVTDLLDGSGLANLPALETTRKIVYQSGSPAFLAEARAALADIRKIVGADAPTKLSDPNGDPLDLIKVYIGVDLEKV